MNECMLCNKKLGETSGFSTLDKGYLCADDYQRVSYRLRKGLFTTEEVLKVKTMIEEQRQERAKYFTELNRLGVTNKWEGKQYVKIISEQLDLIADQVFQKNGAQFLYYEDLTKAFGLAVDYLKAIYKSDKSVSLEGAPYTKLVAQFNRDINYNIAFHSICTPDIKEPLSKMIKTS